MNKATAILRKERAEIEKNMAANRETAARQPQFEMSLRELNARMRAIADEIGEEIEELEEDSDREFEEF